MKNYQKNTQVNLHRPWQKNYKSMLLKVEINGKIIK